jgi:putative acetyltransferase
VIAIRPARPSDDAAIRAVTVRAFGDGHVGDLVDALAAGPARVSLVAEDAGGAVVGHTMLSRGWIDAEQELVEALVLSPLSVEPARQRQGIGSDLVHAAAEAAAERGAPAVFLEGDPAYYERLGFVPGASRGFVRPSARIPQPAFQVLLLPSWQPWMTGALVYPEAFWTMDLVGLRGDTPASVRSVAGEVGD